MKFRLAVAAADDIQSIYKHLSVESPLARERFEARLAEVFVIIREYPLSGRGTNKANVRVRNTHPYPYLVFYRMRTSEILVLRVRHGARNPKTMPARPR